MFTFEHIDCKLLIVFCIRNTFSAAINLFKMMNLGKAKIRILCNNTKSTKTKRYE